MTYELFTKLLSSIGDYEKAIKQLNLKLEVLEYAETGVKGVSYTTTPVSHNPSLSALKRLELVEEVDELKREINFYAMRIDENRSITEKIMMAMPNDLQSMLNDRFIRGMTFSAIAKKYHYSESWLWTLLKKETEKYL